MTQTYTSETKNNKIKMTLTPINNERYISVKSDGRFHEKVSKETEGAVLREYELRDGTKGEKWELLYKDISNVLVTNIRFEDSDFGENILLTLTDGDSEVVWAENTGSNFGTDLMKKLPNVDFSSKVSFKPYAFEDEKGRDKRGVSIFQTDKLSDFFYDGEKKLHGFPEWPKELESMTKDDWKIFFLQVKMFLTDYTKTNIVPKFAEKAEADEVQRPDDEEEQRKLAESIPF